MSGSDDIIDFGIPRNCGVIRSTDNIGDCHYVWFILDNKRVMRCYTRRISFCLSISRYERFPIDKPGISDIIMI